MSDLLQVSDLEKTKLHNTFHVEAVTGKAGGLSTGANIDYATNAVTGQVQKTLPKILDDLDWSYVGLFADGVTFTDKTDFAVDAVGTQWIYTGSLPFSATAGTVPSEPTYQAVHVRDHNSLSNRNAVGAHDEIYDRRVSSYELLTGNYPVGTYVRVTDKLDNVYLIESGGVADGWDILDAGSGKTARLVTQDENSECSRVIRKNFNSNDGYSSHYHITRIPPKHKAFRMKFSDDLVKVGDELQNSKINFKAFREKERASLVFNAYAWDGVETGDFSADPTGRPLGLVIADGVALQDFEPSTTPIRGTTAFVINRDNSYTIAQNTDNKTAQDYVDEGAWVSLGFNIKQLVSNGVGATFTDTSVSARSAICAMDNGDYAIIQTSGKSGVWGMTWTEFVSLLVNEGAVDAIAFDGGGSAQCMKDDFFVQPSSDNKSRDVGGGVLCIDTPCANFSSDWQTWGLGGDASTGMNVQMKQTENRITVWANGTLNKTQDLNTFYNIAFSDPFKIELTNYYSGSLDPTKASRSKCVAASSAGANQTLLVQGSSVNISSSTGNLSVTRGSGGFVTNAVMVPSGSIAGQISYPSRFLVEEYV